jgi:UDP-N-acetylglucosamine--N-acetylmuramyl-(pentapeptide) pyrophosphoryl-undecaprenol N-acetylglucosamine transferase
MTESVDVRILFTGGGSGGHVYPLLAVADELKKLSVNEKSVVELDYLGPHDAFAELFKKENFNVRMIFTGKLRRYLSLQNILDVPKFFLGLVQALFVVWWIMPDVIFSKGGTGALPVVIAGWFYLIPVIIHESDAKPGLTNLFSSWFAKRIAVSFELAQRYFNSKKTALVGAPIRKSVFSGKIDQAQAKEALGFDAKRPLIVILGGSQGSTRINQFILENLENILKDAQVLHQTGPTNFSEIERLSGAVVKGLPLELGKKTRYHAIQYLKENEMANALGAADLVISRAGSGTIFEIAAFGKPAVLIPLEEAANDHQRINAYEFARSGGAVVIEEANLLPGLFMTQLRTILGNPQKLTQMGAASEKFYRPGAAEAIAQEIWRLAQ